MHSWQVLTLIYVLSLSFTFIKNYLSEGGASSHLSTSISERALSHHDIIPETLLPTDYSVIPFDSRIRWKAHLAEQGKNSHLRTDGLLAIPNC